jgi:hypothetical protein
LGLLVVGVGEKIYGLTSTLRALAKRAGLREINMGISLSSNSNL